MNKYKRVFAKVNLKNIEQNYINMEKAVGDGTKLMCVVKTDGYGHGAVPIANLLEERESLFGYAVATVEEALELRKAGIYKPVLILGYTFPDCYESLASKNIMPTVFRPDSLEELSEASQKAGRRIKVHIKVDTGMSRIGITPDEKGMQFVKQVLETKGLILDGMFTHFACADEEDKSSAMEQLRLFRAFTDRVEETFGITIPNKHCANSAGIMEMPAAYMGLARAGISLYGIYPSYQVDHCRMQLYPALSLYSHIVFVKAIKKGTRVSYGGTFVAEKDMRIATIPVGYGDGYPRSLSDVGYVLIHGKRAQILGRVCMDQMMVDVSHIPEALEDDLVTLIGRDGYATISMEELGFLSGRFHYELACDLGKRIPRIFVYE